MNTSYIKTILLDDPAEEVSEVPKPSTIEALEAETVNVADSDNHTENKEDQEAKASETQVVLLSVPSEASTDNKLKEHEKVKGVKMNTKITNLPVQSGNETAKTEDAEVNKNISGAAAEESTEKSSTSKTPSASDSEAPGDNKPPTITETEVLNGTLDDNTKTEDAAKTKEDNTTKIEPVNADANQSVAQEPSNEAATEQSNTDGENNQTTESNVPNVTVNLGKVDVAKVDANETKEKITIKGVEGANNTEDANETNTATEVTKTEKETDKVELAESDKQPGGVLTKTAAGEGNTTAKEATATGNGTDVQLESIKDSDAGGKKKL